MKDEFDSTIKRKSYFSRDDSRTERKEESSEPRRDANSEKPSFIRDKRPRISRPVADRANDRERNSGAAGTERRSFNPNFSEDNRRKDPAGERRSSGYNRETSSEPRERNFNREPRTGGYNREGGERTGGYNRENGERSTGGYNRDGNSTREPRTGGYNREGGERSTGRYNRDENSPRTGGYNRDENSTREPRTGGYNREGGERSTGGYNKDSRTPGGFSKSNRFGGDKKYGDKKYGEKKYGDKKFGEKTFGAKKYGEYKKADKPYPDGGFDSEHKPTSYPRFSAPQINEPIRLNKFISMSGVCSRREADELIKEGIITVNGEVITELGYKINPKDEVCHNGNPLQGEKKVYILMNKPKGFVTTVEDPNADRTVMEIIKNACNERVYPVGRLDKNSLGVLLITNDGEITKKLTHPSHDKKKVYQVSLDKSIPLEDMEKICKGIELEDGIAIADEVSYTDHTRKEVGIAIHSGKNRIVRRIFESLGYRVQKLDRVYFAGLTKKGLRRGAWRYLTPKEVSMMKAGSYE